MQKARHPGLWIAFPRPSVCSIFWVAMKATFSFGKRDCKWAGRENARAIERTQKMHLGVLLPVIRFRNRGADTCIFFFPQLPSSSSPSPVTPNHTPFIFVFLGCQTISSMWEFCQPRVRCVFPILWFDILKSPLPPCSVLISR